VRIVVADGRLTVDENRRLPGRGAYVCPGTTCAASLLKRKGRLVRVLRASLSSDEETRFLQGFLTVREGDE
jgi:hypothetical protein